MNTLHAPTLTLEPQVAAHAPEMFAVLSDPAIYEFENEPPSSEDWLHQRFVKLESRASGDGSEAWLNWIVRLPSGELAGYVQATVTSDGVADVAYVLASRFWRRGIGSLAVATMLKELSAQYGVRHGVATLKARNLRSLALLECLGFRAATAAQSAASAPDPDERVMYKKLGSAEDTV